MRLTMLRSASLFLFVVGVESSFGGTINLVSGSIDYPNLTVGDGTVHFVGDRGFTFDGAALLSPLGAAGCNPCNPGSTISLHASASGNDLPGEATLDGTSYSDVGGLTSPESLSFDINGQVVAPPIGQSSTEILVVPVAFGGTFIHRQLPVIPFNPTSETLVAGAIATLTLSQTVFPDGHPGWRATHVTYDIVATLPIVIDIKPGTSENPINTNSHGKIPVAILSTETFDAATMIDPQTLRFGATGEEASLASCSKGGQDVNHDGLVDQLCSFATEATDFHEGDTIGVLTGMTFDGTPVRGTDSIRVHQ
jgi:hypothetical protein